MYPVSSHYTMSTRHGDHTSRSKSHQLSVQGPSVKHAHYSSHSQIF